MRAVRHAAAAWLAVAWLLPVTAWPAALHDHPAPAVLAPGYADLEFLPPPPGSYGLPSLGPAADGPVVDSTGTRRTLHDVYGGNLVVLSFIYTRCSDVNGCPLATFVLGRLADRLREAGLARSVNLVSFSFDPAHDTPEVLSEYAGHFRKPGADWTFVTSPSDDDLTTLLGAYDQWVIRDYDADGNFVGTMSHVLRVYLVDAQHQIRNIYSVSFLHPDTVINDIRTLLGE